MASYFIKRHDKVHGPLTGDKLLGLAKARKIQSTDEISSSKDGPWQAVSSVSALKAIFEKLTAVPGKKSREPQVESLPPRVSERTVPQSTLPPAPLKVTPENIGEPNAELSPAKPASQPALEPGNGMAAVLDTDSPIRSGKRRGQQSLLDSWGPSRIVHLAAALITSVGAIILVSISGKTYTAILRTLTFKITAENPKLDLAPFFDAVSPASVTIGFILFFMGLILTCISFGLPNLSHSFSLTGRILNSGLAILLIVGALLYVYGNHVVISGSGLASIATGSAYTALDLEKSVNSGNHFVMCGSILWLLGSTINLSASFFGFAKRKQRFSLAHSLCISLIPAFFVVMLAIGSCVLAVTAEFGLIQAVGEVINANYSPNSIATGLYMHVRLRAILPWLILGTSLIIVSAGWLAIFPAGGLVSKKELLTNESTESIPSRTSAIIAMALGITSVFLGPIFGIVAIGLSFPHLAPRSGAQSDPTARQFALIGVILGFISIVIMTVTICFAVSNLSLVALLAIEQNLP